MRLVFLNSGMFWAASKSVSKVRIFWILWSRMRMRVVQSVSVGIMFGCFRMYDFAVENWFSSTLWISIFSLSCMSVSSCWMMVAFLVLAHATVRHSFSM